MHQYKGPIGPKEPLDGVEKFLIVLIFVLLWLFVWVLTAEGQTADTTSQHSTLHKAIEAAATLYGPSDGMQITRDQSSYYYVISDSLGIRIEQSQVYRLDFTAPEARVDSVFFHPEHPLVRSFYYTIEQTPGSPEWSFRMRGQSEADSVHLGTKCVGYDEAGQAIDERRSAAMSPDPEGRFDTTLGPYRCNQLMTYELRATDAGTEVVAKRYIDIAVVLSLGGQ